MKISDLCLIFVLCFSSVLIQDVYARESLLEGNVNTRVEHNDNIFLTDQPHDSVSAIMVTPSLFGIIKEETWETVLNARFSFNRYSDDNLNSNDQYFDLTGRYNLERNIFSLNINHNLDSNLSSTSTDFGIVGRRINRKMQGITPQYTRLITERLVLVLSYTYSDVNFLEAENTGFRPYISESGSATVLYDLTEKDRLTLSLQAVDYNSSDDLVTYQLFMTRAGIDHEISETLSVDFLIGGSRRNSTNLDMQRRDFFGNIIVVPVEVDSKDRGFVLDAGITKKLERGEIEGRISRDNTTNSFGGLDQLDKIKINYREKISSLWRYDISARIEDVTSISSAASSTDRDVLFFESRVLYSINKDWDAIASYRYIQRKFKSSGSNATAPHSNRIYIGLTYNFPRLSTF